MEFLAGSPYVKLGFDKLGVLEAGGAADLNAALAPDGVADLVVISHGWKFEGEQPRAFYQRVWEKVAPLLPHPERVVVAGVSWPSKRYTTGIDAEELQGQASGGGVLSAGGDGERDLTAEEADAALAAICEALEPEREAAIRAAAAAYFGAQTDSTALALLEAATPGQGFGADAGDDAGDTGPLLEALAAPGTTLIRLEDPPVLDRAAGAGGTLGLGQAVGGLFRGPRAGAIRLLEQFSYFEMKERAGKVGQGLGATLGQVVPARPTRLHLVGHSFGARVVTAAAAAIPGTASLAVSSLTLLQGAFSHNALSARRGGAFRNVPARVAGPIAITHTHNDWACTVMYALASRASGDTVKRFGDKNDKFGAMGANGAQFDAGETMALLGGPDFAMTPGRITNFQADGFITAPDAHNNVANASVGRLIAAAIT